MKTNRIVTTILLLLCLHNGTIAQEQDFLMASAKLDTQRASLKEIVKHIQIIDQVQLSYSEETIKDLEIDIPEGTITVKGLLDLLAARGGLSYKIVGKNIIIKEAPATATQEKDYVISGYVYDEKTGETLIGATIQLKGTVSGTSTNVYGFYSLKLPAGAHTLIYSSIGLQPKEQDIVLTDNQRVDIRLATDTKVLEAVVVTAEKPIDHVASNQMGFETLKAQTISKIPALMGEVDVLRVLKLLPGVQMTSETSSGFSVRGGGADQNLILLDEAVVYNPSHLFGFFSTFNNDAIKSMEFYKGNMPARYGGRLASLLDIRMKEGNNQKISGKGGISPISSRLTLEVPIVKSKGSIMLSGRRTYADFIARLSRNEAAKNTVLFFYDFNLKANYTINENNRIYVSSYLGKDVLEVKGNNFAPGFRWGNMTTTARWNNIVNEKLFVNTSLIFSNYDYKLGFGQENFSFDWKSNLRDYSAKVDFDYFLNPRNTITFGVSSTIHRFDPGEVNLESEGEKGSARIPVNRALDHAIYIGNEQKISDKFSMSYGGRLAIFQNIGKGTSYTFDENFKRIDSTGYKSGEIYNTYTSFEPRIAATYLLTKKSSLKASYARTTQFLHLASNSISGTPLDVWIPSSPNIKPQFADQVSLGFFQNLANDKIQASVEVYYKWMDNQIDFRDHASLLLNEEIEGEIRVGEAQAYGAEFLLKKPSGRWNGWISFTLSKSLRTISEINNGDEYNSNFDRPINLSVVSNYDITKRIRLSTSWTYFSGLPLTAPSGRMHYGNRVIPTYTERNGDRLPDYHRLDVGVNFETKQKPGKKIKSSWNVSVYNAYGRKNPAFITFRQNEDNPLETEAQQSTLFRWVPTITWNFEF